MVLNLILIAAVAATAPAPKRVYLLEEKIDLKRGSESAEAVLSIAEATVVRGRRMSFTAVVFSNSGGRYYNPYYTRGIPLPAVLAIFDAKGQYLGDLLDVETISNSSVTEENWVWLPAGGCIGARIARTAGIVPRTKYNSSNSQLPAGEYQVQMIYLNAFCIFPALAVAEDKKQAEMEFYKTFDRKELFRSNVVKIQIVDRQTK